MAWIDNMDSTIAKHRERCNELWEQYGGWRQGIMQESPEEASEALVEYLNRSKLLEFLEGDRLNYYKALSILRK